MKISHEMLISYNNISTSYDSKIKRHVGLLARPVYGAEGKPGYHQPPFQVLLPVLPNVPIPYGHQGRKSNNTVLEL